MNHPDAPVPMSLLLTHREWVRRIARSMVHDDATADDVAQRTWLAALRGAPRDAGAARSWLSRVVRSKALNMRREGDRRAVHESAARRGEAVRSAAEVVAEAESHRRLVVAVHRLAEPYRTTVLLRFFEDLPPREVAERMGVPVETVRTRIRRALAVLRDDLGTEREAWLAVLAPVVGVRLDAGTTAATMTGGAAVATKGTVVGAVVVLALTAGYVGGSLPGSGAAETPSGDLQALTARLAVLEAERGEDGVHASGLSSATASQRRVARADQGRAEQERRLTALEGEVAELRARVAAANDAGRTAAGESTSADNVELRRLESLTTPQLLAELRTLSAASTRAGAPRSDGEAALRAARVLRERPLDTPERGEAWFLEGRAHLGAGNANDEEVAYRKTIEILGPDSHLGRLAAAQLGWVASRNRDPRGAAEWFLSVARQPGASAGERSRYRYVAANVLAGTGDVADRDRARTHFREVVDEFGESPDEEARRTADLCRKALAALESAGR